MRSAFINALYDIAEQDERIWLLSGDLGFSVLEVFAQKYANRYVNMGVAEQNMTGVAAGLALEGKIVFTYSIANFPIMRCLEQIRNDICYHQLPVKIVTVGGGVAYGAAGYTHFAIEDLAIMRALPNMTVIAPGDPAEVRAAIHWIINSNGPAYLRLGKGGEPVIHSDSEQLAIQKPIWVIRGMDVVFIATGGILGQVVIAAKALREKGVDAGVVSLPMLKPLDTDSIIQIGQSAKGIVTVEEHSESGGLGELLASVLINTHTPEKFFEKVYYPSSQIYALGSQDYLRRKVGLNSSHLIEVVEAHLLTR